MAAVNRDFDKESSQEEEDIRTPEISLEQMRLLVSMRFDPTKPGKMRNKHGQTPLHVAAQKGSLTEVKILIRLEAINCLDGRGASPLWTALSYGRLSVAEYLLAQGAKEPLKAPKQPAFTDESMKERLRVRRYLRDMHDPKDAA